MKLHVNKDGSFDLDLNGTDDLNKAAKFIREIQNTPSPQDSSHDGGNDLNGLQYAAWTWLIENDNEHGVHFTAMARAMRITEKAASQRCTRLMNMGYAERVGAGKYRAKC